MLGLVGLSGIAPERKHLNSPDLNPVAITSHLAVCCRATWPDKTQHNMEEDPTPIPSIGMRKSLITDAKGVITGEEVEQDLGHTESGCDVLLVQNE